MAKKAQTPAPETATERPYYLQRAHIKDFRSIRDAEVEFKPGLNIIIGPNGSGKTNFVRVVNSATLELNHKHLGRSNYFLFKGRHIIGLTFDKITPSDRFDITSSQSIMDRNKWTIDVTVDGEKYSESDLAGPWSERTGEQKPYIELPRNNQLIRYGIPSEYKLVSTPSDISLDNFSLGSSGHYTELGIAINSGISFSIFQSSIKRNNNKLVSTKFVLDIITRVTDFYFKLIIYYLKKYTLIQDLRLNKSIQLYNNSSQREILIKGMLIEFKVDEDWLPFDALSSGTQRLFYIISEIASKIDRYAPFLTEKIGLATTLPSIILLEEPELGIHPDQLHLLLQFLREQSKKHQLIITTHSPQVLDMLEEDELDRITICELHKTKGTQFRKLKKTQIDTARRFMREKGLFLSDYWRYGSLEKPTKAAR